MSTKHADIFNRLAAPFANGDVKTRPAGGGRQLHYITARTAMNRLDDVLGPENWSDRYYEVCGVLFCEIAIRLPDGSTVTKADAGGFKEMTTKDKGREVKDEENTDKTGPSDAFKRAAAKFGVGRYLYGDGVPYYEPAPEPAPEPVNEGPPTADGNGAGKFWAFLDELAREFGAENSYAVVNRIYKFAAQDGHVDGQAKKPGEKADQLRDWVKGQTDPAQRKTALAYLRGAADPNNPEFAHP